MPPGHLPLEPTVHHAEGNRHWMKSSTPNARTTRTCATPYRTAGTSSTPSGMADHSSLYHLPHHKESPASPGSLSSRKGEGWSISMHRQGHQRHLWRSWSTGEQEVAKAQ
jgi:hypothetical protein